MDEHDETFDDQESRDPTGDQPGDETVDQAGDETTSPEATSSLTTQDWQWEQTGHAGVDQVLSGLDELDDDVHGHVAVFEETHRSLREILDGAGAEAAAEDATEG